MKPIRFEGDSLTVIRSFPAGVQHDVGYQLRKVQIGEQPKDFKPMTIIGRGVEELRMRDSSGAYRVIYTARLSNAVHVLHAFQKKTERTVQADIELARTRLTALLRTTRG